MHFTGLQMWTVPVTPSPPAQTHPQHPFHQAPAFAADAEAKLAGGGGRMRKKGGGRGGGRVSIGAHQKTLASLAAGKACKVGCGFYTVEATSTNMEMVAKADSPPFFIAFLQFKHRAMSSCTMAVKGNNPPPSPPCFLQYPLIAPFLAHPWRPPYSFWRPNDDINCRVYIEPHIAHQPHKTPHNN